MALSIFAEKDSPPAAADLRKALGAAIDLWTSLIASVRKRIAPLREEWGYSGKSTGWGLRLRHHDRILVYMTPRDGHFLASFVLGDKAVKAIEAAGVPETVLSAIRNARRYAEGRGVRFEIRERTDLAGLVTIAIAKLEN